MQTVLVGIDAGSYSAKAVLLADGEVLARATAVAGLRSIAEAAEGAFAQVLSIAGVERSVVTRVVATGSGAGNVAFADETALEVICIARGTTHHLHTVGTVLDVGAEHCVAVGCSNGQALAVARTDRCAAGAGILLKVVAEVLEVSLDDMGPMALGGGETAEISFRCAVFAESEIISLVHSGISKESIVRGVYQGLAARLRPLVRRSGGRDEVAVIGGGAEDVGLVAALEERLGKSVCVPPHPATVSALGAALVAGDRVDH
ncbi:MAG: acyl-CoA dehydratase activase [Rhodoferax sp.]|uniref:acyl-CoA dehydratase activase n=1 Tax=Rhodoferax sp. TaxID=50421 RepID=UPI00260EF7DB|nr:acyl-CoA dehydratase activase [Rhodoferax sp.]MDD5335393.1 acyl-CoA dehydratase activase [Rhodoferax sp.]